MSGQFDQLRGLIAQAKDAASRLGVTGPGLLNGRAGWSYLSYRLFMVTADGFWEAAAENYLYGLLDVEGAKGVGFLEGSAGVGWTIEWIVQSGLMEGSTDNLLGQLDGMLLQTVYSGPRNELGLRYGTVGLLAYFLKRWENQETRKSELRHICLEEVLVILSDDISTGIGREGRDFKYRVTGDETVEELKDWSDALILLSVLEKNKINVAAVRRAGETLTSSLLAWAKNHFSNISGDGSEPKSIFFLYGVFAVMFRQFTINGYLAEDDCSWLVDECLKLTPKGYKGDKLLLLCVLSRVWALIRRDRDMEEFCAIMSTITVSDLNAFNTGDLASMLEACANCLEESMDWGRALVFR